MVNLFVVLSCILAVLMVCGIVRISTYSGKVKSLVQYLYILAVIAMIFNAASVSVPDRFFATLFYGLYLAVINWLVIVLLLYAQRYTESKWEIAPVKITVYILSAINTISMIVNAWTGHVFDMKWVSIYGVDHCYTLDNVTLLHSLHMVFVYLIIIMVILTFMYKVIYSIPIYRIKYLSVLLCLAVVLAANLGYRFADIPMDISSVLYILMAFVIAYFSIYHVPKGLIASILDSAVRELNDGIVCYDSENRCIYCNAKGEEYFQLPGPGLEADDRFKSWLDGRNAGEIGKSTWNKEVKVSDRTYIHEVTFCPIVDNRKHYIGCYFHVHDITDSYNRIKKERFRATHDNLTGCLNRNGFFEAVRKVIDEEPDAKRYMLVTDIRNFKLVNELFGTRRGDSILIRTADLLRQIVPDDAVYGRLTSDRFAMCIKKDELDIKALERAVSELAQMARNSVYRMHTHIGIYEIRDNNMEISVMCDRAILAISKNKDNLENIVFHYDKSISQEIQARGYILAEFENAIETGQFHMFLQPQISTIGHKLLGGEALVRWIHPEKGMISPGEFIPVFENTGVIYKLDKYIWECACKQLRRWKDAGKDNIHISVNISPKDFFYIDIYKTLTELVEKYEIDPVNLKLEITETAMMNNIEVQMDVLDRLHNYGFCIEIDDFGSGYSSLNTLKDLKVDVLKIDMGFLGETMHSDRSRIILNSVVAMSKKLGLVTVTEGVETEAQIDYLTGVGCDIMQGYYFSKPIPADEFEKKYSII